MRQYPAAARRTADIMLVRQVGRRLRWLREAIGHTQTEWARALRISNQQLNKWEAGARTPNLNTLIIAVQSTGASFDYLFLGRLTPEMNRELATRLHEEHAAELELHTQRLPARRSLAACAAAPHRRTR